MTKKTSFFYFLILLILLSCSKPIKKNSLELDSNVEKQDCYLEENINIAEYQSQKLKDHIGAFNSLYEISKNKNLYSIATDSLVSKMYHKMGVYSYRMGENHQAVKSLDSAIAIRSNGNTELMNLSNSLYVRSLAHDSNLFYTNALEDLLAAIEIEEVNFKRREILGEYYSKLALFYAKNKDFGNAIKYHEEALIRLKLENHPRAICLGDYAKFLIDIGDKKEALKYYEEALSIFLKIPNETINIIVTKFNILNLVVEELEYSEIIKKYKLFLEYLSSVDSNNYVQKIMTICYNNMAVYNMQNGLIKEGMKNYHHTLNMARQLSNSENDVYIARAFEGIGDGYSHLQKLDSSAFFYNVALQSVCVGYKNDNLFDSPNPKNHVIINQGEIERIVGLKANVLFNKYYPRNDKEGLLSLLQMYKDIDLTMSYLKSSFVSSKSKFDLLARTAYLIEQAIKVALKLYKITGEHQYLEEAYFFSSKNKAIVLLDEKEFEFNKLKGIPKAIITKEKDLLKEIRDYDEKIINSKNNSTIDSTELLISKRFDQFRKLEIFRSEIKRDYPKYYELKYDPSSKVNLTDLRTKLPDSTAVLEFFIGKDSIYTFYFSKNQSLKYYVSEKKKSFEEDCIQFRSMIEEDTLLSFQQFSIKSNNLYKLLFENPLIELQKHEAITRLFIIPDDHLLQMSFDALITKIDDADDKNGWTTSPSYLINDFALSIAYSNQLLISESKKQNDKKYLKNYIGFGLEYKGNLSEELDSLSLNKINISVRNKMGKLTHSCDEIRESAELFNGATYLNNEATKERFLSKAKNANILHIAAHGFISKEYPLSSGLIMSNHLKQKSSVLKASDIYSLSLNCDMTLLSACQTANGVINKGEGIQSLARAFYYAGCPNVMASLWNTPDYSTKEIVVNYFQYIKNGLPKDIALQKAKTNYLNNCEFNKDALPCNWSHLISTGSQEPIHFKKSWSFW